jgi:hypothetical protein
MIYKRVLFSTQNDNVTNQQPDGVGACYFLGRVWFMRLLLLYCLIINCFDFCRQLFYPLKFRALPPFFLVALMHF